MVALMSLTHVVWVCSFGTSCMLQMCLHEGLTLLKFGMKCEGKFVPDSLTIHVAILSMSNVLQQLA